MAYVARKGKKWFVVVGGQAGPGYDAYVKKTLIFSAAAVIAYLAIRDRMLIRVTSTHKP